MKLVRPSLVLTAALLLLCCVVYPAVVTALAQTLFPRQANGSLIRAGDKVIGSEIIGQNFSKPEYFHPRPSAAGSGYDATSSAGSSVKVAPWS